MEKVNISYEDGSKNEPDTDKEITRRNFLKVGLFAAAAAGGYHLNKLIPDKENMNPDLKEKKEYPICTAEGSQLDVGIYGDRIVWLDGRNGCADIYMYDLKEKKEYPICTAERNQRYPAIYGDRIVWEDSRNNRNWDIYMYDLKTNKEIPICTAEGDQQRPAIYGDRIVWDDKRSGSYDIYICMI